MWMMWNKKFDEVKYNTSYINTVYRTTQYSLYILQKYVKNSQFLNCDEQFLKKNKEKRKIQEVGALDSVFENNT